MGQFRTDYLPMQNQYPVGVREFVQPHFSDKRDKSVTLNEY